MALPLIPIIFALAAGGSLVPHAAGGLIVSSAGGYVAGTYLSSAAISSLLLGSGALLGVGALSASGIATAIIGSAGYFGTTVGATGITGWLMSAGIISATPIMYTVGVGLAGLGGVALTGVILRLRHKLKLASKGQEVIFNAIEAKIIEVLVVFFAKKSGLRSEV
ncbi:hypothetical protein [Pseudomonas mandelii]|uniref:Uncharacterized protein n=1 Tax=Pseudomonas mandelii TaxID=75612 RepID=A0AB36CXP4_9PSED|nr:hypothetical protein [Pseudomonas mandelii]NMZ80812.1 hypothetical protein [Pseudomonas mandelii]